LEVTAKKCRLLGYWADETKGYRLEDAETGKLITSRDVRFVEDERPSDLAVIEGDRHDFRAGELMEVQPDGTLQPVVPKPAEQAVRDNMFTNNDESAPIPEPEIQPIEPEPVPDPNASMPRAARNKWADLPR
jgi:hypothetical protein